MTEIKSIKLQDGRDLAYAEYGKIDSNIKIIYLHGTPCSRLEPLAWLDGPNTLDAHLVAVDRPGLGRSTIQANRTLLDFPKDIVQLVDQLKWDRFSIVGVSGGGPYALACAYAIDPIRVKSIGVICGSGSTTTGFKGVAWSQRLSWWATRHLPLLTKLFIKLVFGRLTKDSNKKLMTKLVKMGLDADKTKESGEVIEKLDAEKVSEAFREAFYQGTEGYVQEAFVMVAPWGFELENVRSPSRIKMWYGDKDDICSAAIGSKMAGLLRAELTVMKGYGHAGVFASISQIMTEFIGNLHAAK